MMMGKLLVYLRTSTGKQDLNQKLETLKYTRRHALHIDDFIATAISARKSPRDRHLDELLAQLHTGDTLVVTELSRLGRVYPIKGGVVITPESIAQMGKDAIWKPWAEKGWTLHQAPDGLVMAVNVAGCIAIERAQRFTTLVSRLEKGTFSYKEFLDFKKFHTP